jgi:hypothetical protein
MASQLTTVAIKSRKIIRYSIYFFICFMIGRFLLGLGVSTYQTLFPKKVPPTVAFGRLTPIPFPKKENLPQFTYKIETPDGKLPAFPDQAKVYFMPRSTTNLLSEEGAKAKARGLGFNVEPEEVTPTLFRFRQPQFPATLEINIVTGIFSVSYNLGADPSPVETVPPTPEVATAAGRSFLSQAGNFPEDLTGEPTHEFLRVDSQGITRALSLSEANLVKVNLIRKDYDKLHAKTADPNSSNVWFIVSGDKDRDRQIIASEFHYFPVDEEQFATYPIKTAEEAFQELQAGKGYIADIGQNQDGQVTIRRMELAYYDPSQYTEFYQPIYVFQGDRNFYAYVSAVTSEYSGQ